MPAAPQHAPGTTVVTDVPARLDRLPWSRWHWTLVTALGITWVLDGLEVTIVASIASVLQEHDTLALTASQLGVSASAYLAGSILGALLFGHLTDRLGRKKLFLVTLGVYLTATLCTALSWGLISFCVCRFFTGAGIGGEYAAINSAIDELIPARVRGRVDLAINSSYWAGTAAGAASTLLLLDPDVLPHRVGWRVCFGLGAILGLAVLLVRRHVPESPRWLLMHGHEKEASRVVGEIEAHVVRDGHALPPARPAPVHVTGSVGFGHVARVLLKRHRRRTVLGLTLMLAQAFFYNAVSFTYALVLHQYYGVPSGRVGLYLLPFALGNMVGPMALGHLFDTLGRRAMIAGTYALSGLMLAATGLAFERGALTAVTQTIAWSAVFFVASSAASSAYLTVSELFPVELRGMAIALFYAAGTAAGGLFAPSLFGALVQSGSRHEVFLGYLFGAALMVGAAVVAAVLGVAAEGRSLEELAEA